MQRVCCQSARRLRCVTQEFNILYIIRGLIFFDIKYDIPGTLTAQVQPFLTPFQANDFLESAAKAIGKGGPVGTLCVGIFSIFIIYSFFLMF